MLSIRLEIHLGTPSVRLLGAEAVWAEATPESPANAMSSSPANTSASGAAGAVVRFRYLSVVPAFVPFKRAALSSKANQYLGIYELGENTRKMCFAPSGKERPTEFSSTGGSGLICLTFERVKTP